MYAIKISYVVLSVVLKMLVLKFRGKIMTKLKPCPFECVMIISKGFEGCSNIIHIKSGLCLAMANPQMTKDFKKLIKAWNRRIDEQGLFIRKKVPHISTSC